MLHVQETRILCKGENSLSLSLSLSLSIVRNIYYVAILNIKYITKHLFAAELLHLS